MQKASYDDPLFNCIVPENALEEEVLRRAILPDGVDQLPGAIHEMEKVHLKVAVNGGRFVLDDWCTEVAVHYQLLERVSDGWYSLQVAFWHRRTAQDLGGFSVWAALRTFPPLVQAPWIGHRRTEHPHPVWRLPPRVDLSETTSVPLLGNLPKHDSLFLLAVSSVRSYEQFEWNPVVPHLRLVDPVQLVRVAF